MDDLIVNVAMTGCVHSQAANRALPITPEEIGLDAARCANEGASIFHLHARDQDGNPTMDLVPIQNTVDAVREAVPGAIVCVSCSGRHDYELIGRTRGLYVDPAPEMASLTLGSYNSFAHVIVNLPNSIRNLGSMMISGGIVPELECFDIGHIAYAKYLIEKNVLKPPFWFNLFLGNLGTIPASPWLFLNMVEMLPPSAFWAATGIGHFQWRVNQWAVDHGGHVRVGLEDSLWMDENKQHPATNADQVARVVQYAREQGREPASIEQVRELLGMEME